MARDRVVIHWNSQEKIFWAELDRSQKDIVKNVGFKFHVYPSTYHRQLPKDCPVCKLTLNYVWWTSEHYVANKLPQYLDAEAANEINRWISSGEAEKRQEEFKEEASKKLIIHYNANTKVFWAEFGKQHIQILREKCLRPHDKDYVSQSGYRHNNDTCYACKLQVPDKTFYTTSIDEAYSLAEFADDEVKEVFRKWQATIDQSRATDANIIIPAPKGLKPFNYQKAGIAWALERKGSLIGDEMGLGKACINSTKILTPTGWIEIERLEVNDLVIGVDGKPTKVIGVYPQGKIDTYKITFNDKTSIIVSEDHLWAARTNNDQYRDNPWRTKKTKDLIDNIKDVNGNNIWRIPVIENPAELDNNEDRPIDPYILGVLLGDGCLSSTNSICYCPGDKLVPREVENVLTKEYKHTVSLQEPETENIYRITTEPQNATNPILNSMRQFGLIGIPGNRRFVPKSYLFAPKEIRLAILQGLLDTDGECRDDSMVQFSSCSKQLVEDVAFLCQSLGGISRIDKPRFTKYEYKNEIKRGQLSHRVSLSFPDGIVPVRAHIDEFVPKTKYKPNKIINNIEYFGKEECTCIAIEADHHLYVAENFIVTHNTIQGLGVINLDKSIKDIIIFCPVSLKINWKKEAEKWLVHKHKIAIVSDVGDVLMRDSRSDPNTVHIMIIGFQSIVGSGKRAKTLREYLFHIPSYDLIIVDEAHRLKNPESQTSQYIAGYQEYDKTKKENIEHKGISSAAKRKIYLTGTPIKNRPIEIFQLVHSLDPDNYPSWLHFAERYAAACLETIYVPGGHGATKQVLNVKGASHTEELNNKLRSTVMIARFKEDVLTELPPKTRQLIELEPDDEVKELIRQEKAAGGIAKKIDDIINQAKADGSDKAYASAADKLEQFKAKFEELSKIRASLGQLKIPYVVEHVKDLIDSMTEGQEKIIIFAHHRNVVEKLEEELKEFNPVKLYGGMNDDVKNYAVEKFQNDPNTKVFIGSIAAAGVGLTLHAANVVVFAELDWSPSEILQAEDRAHRIGQKRNVLIQHLVFDDSLDAKIVKAFLDKLEVINAILKGRPEIEQVKQEEIKAPEIPEIEIRPVEVVERKYEPPKDVVKHGGQFDPHIGPSGGGIESSGREKGKPTKDVGITTEIFTYTDEQKDAALIALRDIAGVCDYAQSKDFMGFNKTYTKAGHSLALWDHLTDGVMPEAINILNVHRKQVPYWIRDVLGLWPANEKSKYTKQQKEVFYKVARAIIYSDSESIREPFTKEELEQIKEIADTSIEEHGIERTFSDTILFAFRNILSDHWKEIDPTIIAVLNSVKIKPATKRERSEEVISGEEKEIESKDEPETPATVSVFFARTKDNRFQIKVFIEDNTYTLITIRDSEIFSRKTRITDKQELATEVTNIIVNTAKNNLIYNIEKNYIGVDEDEIKRRIAASSAPEEITDFVKMGEEAFAKGIKRAPRLDSKLQDLLKKYGSNTKEYIKAADDWLKGWDKANLAKPVSVEIEEEEEEEKIVEGKPPVPTYNEAQKSAIFSAMIMLSMVVSQPSFKKLFSDVEKKILVGLNHAFMREGKSWSSYDNQQIHEMRTMLDKYANVHDEDTYEYLKSLGITLGKKPTPVPSAPVKPITVPAKPEPKPVESAPAPEPVKPIISKPAPAKPTPAKPRYSAYQRKIAEFAIDKLRSYFATQLSKAQLAKYEKSTIDNIKRLATMSRPFTDKQIDEVREVVASHKNVYTGTNILDILKI